MTDILTTFTTYPNNNISHRHCFWAEFSCISLTVFFLLYPLTIFTRAHEDTRGVVVGVVVHVYAHVVLCQHRALRPTARLSRATNRSKCYKLVFVQSHISLLFTGIVKRNRPWRPYLNDCVYIEIMHLTPRYTLLTITCTCMAVAFILHK